MESKKLKSEPLISVVIRSRKDIYKQWAGLISINSKFHKNLGPICRNKVRKRSPCCHPIRSSTAPETAAQRSVANGQLSEGFVWEEPLSWCLGWEYMTGLDFLVVTKTEERRCCGMNAGSPSDNLSFPHCLPIPYPDSAIYKQCPVPTLPRPRTPFV